MALNIPEKQYESNKTKEKEGKRRKSDPNPNEGILVNFPRGVIKLALQEFPAEKQTDAVVCYMCLHSPDMADPAFRKANLTPHQQEMLRGRVNDLGGKLMKANKELASKEDVNRRLVEHAIFFVVIETMFRMGLYDGVGMPTSLNDLVPNRIVTDKVYQFMDKMLPCSNEYWRELKKRWGAGIESISITE